MFFDVTDGADRAVVHIDISALQHTTQLATAIHIAQHMGDVDRLNRMVLVFFGQLVEVDLGVDCGGELIPVEFGMVGVDDTATAAEHMAAIGEGLGHLHSSLLYGIVTVDVRKQTNLTVDVHSGEGLGTVGIVFETDARRTHGGQRATAVHVAVNKTAVDGDIGKLCHRASSITVFVYSVIIIHG